MALDAGVVDGKRRLGGSLGLFGLAAAEVKRAQLGPHFRRASVELGGALECGLGGGEIPDPFQAARQQELEIGAAGVLCDRHERCTEQGDEEQSHQPHVRHQV